MSDRISLHDALAWQAHLAQLRTSERIACERGEKASAIDDLLFSSRTLRWCDVMRTFDALCAQLRTAHVGEHAGVALIGHNSLIQLLLYFAALAVGARVMVLNPHFPAEKLKRICDDNQLLFYWAEKPITLPLTPLALTGALAQSAVNPWHGLSMTLSSGSTGQPKAIVHNVQAHLANACGVCEALKFSAKDTWLYTLPLFHVSGQGIAWRWISQGACLRLPSDDLLADITRCSHCSLVPTQLWRYLKQKKTMQSAVRAGQKVLLGGAYLDPQLCTQAQLQGLEVYRGYGLTEMASTVYIERSGQPHFALLRGRELRVEQGEIWVRGAGLALGRWQQGKIVPIVNAQGWFATRDCGTFDGERLNITGRMDNMFICGGENVQPEEIEQVLYQTGLVSQAYVVGQVDAEFGHKVVAFVAFTQGDFATQSAVLAERIATQIERFKQPVAYYPLPVMAPGAIKISRVALRERVNMIK
ncbi:AMP-binding protein [Pasteurellaceae bacterium HPA106]|uniref:AMP-binding protein n=1 Tax=Spirabiliibacterium pneumoniae TaxID=221400 RepID=UPI001AAC6527|nr:AMP-binding protein [Spirabiliibacterium pneumoniae]MBE2895358.1 AMP-binding protein [Spirabiliibacterium pneumoniae]